MEVVLGTEVPGSGITGSHPDTFSWVLSRQRASVHFQSWVCNGRPHPPAHGFHQSGSYGALRWNNQSVKERITWNDRGTFPSHFRGLFLSELFFSRHQSRGNAKAIQILLKKEIENTKIL